MLDGMLDAVVTGTGECLANKAGAGSGQGEKSLGMHDACRVELLLERS
jgi:hypothetical protein